MITLGQIKSLKYVVGNALIAALEIKNLSLVQAQDLVDNYGGEFADVVRDAIVTFLESKYPVCIAVEKEDRKTPANNRYADKEVESRRAYPLKHKGPKPIGD